MLIYLKKNPYIILILIVSLPFIFLIVRDWDFAGLYSYDPWYQLYFNKYGETKILFSETVQVADGTLNAHYPTFSRSIAFILNIISGISWMEIYKYGGFFSRYLVVFFLIFTGKVLIGVKKYTNHILFCSVLLSIHSYFWLRVWILYPENFGVIFHVITLFFTIRFLKKFDLKDLVFMSFFYISSLYYHQPSSVVSSCIIFGGLFSLMLSKSISKRKKGYFVLFFLLFTIIFLSLNIKNLMEEYGGQLGNVGPDIVPWDSRHRGALINDYINFSSPIWFLVVLLGFFHFFKHFIGKDFQKNITLLPVILVFFLVYYLSQSVNMGFNLPVERMQGFFFLFSSLFIFFNRFNFGKNFKIISLSLSIFLLFNIVNSSYGWYAYWRGEIMIKEFLQSRQSFGVIGFEPFYDIRPENIYLDEATLKNGVLRVSKKVCSEVEKSIFSYNNIHVCQK